MPRLTALDWKVLECIFQKDGFVYYREKSSHKSYIKKRISRPIVIPTYNDVGRDIIIGLMRTAGMSRKRFFELLDECK